MYLLDTLVFCTFMELVLLLHARFGRQDTVSLKYIYINS